MPTAEVAPSAASAPFDVKRTLRSRLRAERSAYALAHPTAAGRVADALWSLLDHLVTDRSSVLSGYAAIGSEIDVLPLLARWTGTGRTAALPVVHEPGAALLFRRWSPGETLIARGKPAIPEPLPSAPALTPDILLIPLLAYDRQGGRLGYGGGFYDRTLCALRQAGRVTAIGVAYAVQAIETVPMEPWDERLDWVVTDAAVWRIAIGFGSDLGHGDR